jgi:hypothetical protein
MYYDILPISSIFFMPKSNYLLQRSLTKIRIRIRIGLAPWIRIRIEVKIWIRIWIRIKTNADPQHWNTDSSVGQSLNFTYYITVYGTE